MLQRLLGYCLAAAVLINGGFAAADDELKPRPAKKVLSEVAKNLVKSSNYKINFQVQGGISTSKDHAISQTTVRDTYSGDLFKTVMYVKEVNAYRTMRKGAIRSGSGWANMLAVPQGTRMDRLFAFPAKLLKDSLNKKNKIEWVYVGDENDVLEEDEDEDDEEGTGGTSVAKKKYGRFAGLPHVIRVEVPAKESVKYFTDVQNSGCVSGG